MKQTSQKLLWLNKALTFSTNLMEDKAAFNDTISQIICSLSPELACVKKNLLISIEECKAQLLDPKHKKVKIFVMTVNSAKTLVFLKLT